MTDDIRIQEETKTFRDEVASWSEKKLRAEGAERGIPGAETLDKTTLREAIVSNERDAKRADSAFDPQVRRSRPSEQPHKPRR